MPAQTSEQLLDQARSGYEAWNRGDTGWFEENMTEDMEVVPVQGLFPDIEDVSEDEIFAIVRFDGVGRESGVEASLTFAHWLNFRDGKLCRLRVEMPDDRERKLAQPGR